MKNKDDPILIVFAIFIIVSMVVGFLYLAKTHYEQENTKPIATAIPNGLGYTQLGNSNQTFVVAAIKLEGIRGFSGITSGIWSVKTFNHTKILEVETSTVDLRVGDVVIFQKIFYGIECNAGVDLRFSDGFEPIVFDINPLNFTLSDIPSYYTENYDVQLKFEKCISLVPATKTFHIVIRDGEFIQKTKVSEEGFNIYD